SRDKPVDDRFVSRVQQHDRFHRGARRLANHHGFHCTLHSALRRLHHCAAHRSRTQAPININVITVDKISGAAKKYSHASTTPAPHASTNAQVMGSKARRSSGLMPPRYHAIHVEKMKNTDTKAPKPR